MNLSQKHLSQKHFMIGLLSIGAVVVSALPSLARPATIDIEANLRSGPSIGATKIDGLPVGTAVEVLRIVGDSDRYRSHWYYVRSQGTLRTEGWVDSGLVRFQSSNARYGTLAGEWGDVINLRSVAGLSGRVLHTGVMGDLVKVGESRSDGERDWYYVTYPNGASGWVREDLIEVWPQGCIITCPDN